MRPCCGLTPAQLQLRQMVVDSVQAPTSKLAYGHSLDQLFAFAASRPLTRTLLQAWRSSMDGLAPSTVNVRLTAVRKLVSEAKKNGLLSGDDAQTLNDIPNVHQQGTRLGNWLTWEQAKQLLAVPVWGKHAINAWQAAAGIEEGRSLRRIRKGGKVAESLSDWAVWDVVRAAAEEIGV